MPQRSFGNSEFGAEFGAEKLAIYSAGHTGHTGDGKVFVLPVLDALRLKTGERGPSALGPPFKKG
jgi:Nitrogen regulatory protein P-II